MRKRRYIRFNFFLNLFFDKKRFPMAYSAINNVKLKTLVYTNNDSNAPDMEYSRYCIYDIPDYLEPEVSSKTKYKLLKTNLYSGFLIDLRWHKNLEDYLNNGIGRARKSQIKRYKKRLDLCIEPEYKVFYGSILKEEYTIIFKTLERITRRRFNEKEELNFELAYFELYEKMMYDLILEKRACIFVIYDRKKPINITLNFIEGDTLFHWNSCYDIDYSVFNLGHINMINHLDWCYDHHIKLFDMGRGDFPHKRKYINTAYNYQEHIIYDTSKFNTTIWAYLSIYKSKLKFVTIRFLKSVNFQKWYSKYAKLKFRMLVKHKAQKEITKSELTENLPDSKGLKKINRNDLPPVLIRSFNYFLHRGQERLSNVDIFAEMDNEKVYYFKSEKRNVKIIISSN